MLPTPPDAHGLAVLLLTILALVLFTRDRIPLETSSLIVLTILIVGFQIFPYSRGAMVVRPVDFFSGFGHQALITVCALMIVGRGLETTGALQPLAKYMADAWVARPLVALLVTLVAAAILSAFINNTPIVVMLLPMLVGVAMRTRTPASGVLMPMGLATIIGGMSTTIGTSTNLLVVAIAADLGLRRLSMFDFTLPALIAGSFGLLFLWLVAPRLLPKRTPPMSDTSPRVFQALLYITEDSYALGRTLSEVLARTDNKMRVDRIQRDKGLFVAKLPSVTFNIGDRLLVRDTPDNLKEFERLLGATLHNVSDDEDLSAEEFALSDEGQALAEVVVTRGSLLHNRTLSASRLAPRFRLFPLALHRAREPNSELTSELGDIRLRSGDVLLVQGSKDAINELKTSGTALVLDGTTDLPHTHRAPRALAIMLFVVLAAATGVMPISVSAMCGVGLMVATHCLSWRDIGSALSAPVIMIIVTSLALGTALMGTGGAEYLAQFFVFMTAELPTPAVLSGLILLMALLTNLVSNNAAAVIGTPIAISIAQQLGSAPEPFVLAVLFGANMSYATPMGYQTNLLILSAGGYKFSDFLRVGIPLTIIMWLAFSIVLPLMYDV